MSEEWAIREATSGDAAACAAIYAPYVTETVITFEEEPPSPAEMDRRIAAALAKHAWLVLERDGDVMGYAYGSSLKGRAAYDWACETSIYLDVQRRGRGMGRALYAALLDRLRERGYRRAYGCITVPNDASIGLHHAFGYVDAGLWTRVGWKHGAWHDVAWLELDLAPGGEPSVAPAPMRA